MTSTIAEEGDERRSKSISSGDDPSHCRSEPPVAAKDVVEVTHAQSVVACGFGDSPPFALLEPALFIAIF